MGHILMDHDRVTGGCSIHAEYKDIGPHRRGVIEGA